MGIEEWQLIDQTEPLMARAQLIEVQLKESGQQYQEAQGLYQTDWLLVILIGLGSGLVGSSMALTMIRRLQQQLGAYRGE